MTRKPAITLAIAILGLSIVGGTVAANVTDHANGIDTTQTPTPTLEELTRLSELYRNDTPVYTTQHTPRFILRNGSYERVDLPPQRFYHVGGNILKWNSNGDSQIQQRELRAAYEAFLEEHSPTT